MENQSKEPKIKTINVPAIRAKQDIYIMNIFAKKLSIGEPPSERDMKSAGITPPRKDCKKCYGRMFVGKVKDISPKTGEEIEKLVLCKCILQAITTRFPVDLFYYIEKEKEKTNGRGDEPSSEATELPEEKAGRGEEVREDSNSEDKPRFKSPSRKGKRS